MSDLPTLATRWSEAAGRPEVAAELESIFADIAEASRDARPLCVASGCCCRFERFGHQLWLSGLETAWFLRRLAAAGRALGAEELDAAIGEGRCPFLEEGFCGVHAIRPFACRTFFCDPRSTAWQNELHERCHDRIRALHERLELPYRYGEWRAMLAAFVGGGSGAGSGPGSPAGGAAGG